VCITTKDVISWGSNEYGQLGHGDQAPDICSKPCPIKQLHDVLVTQVLPALLLWPSGAGGCGAAAVWCSSSVVQQQSGKMVQQSSLGSNLGQQTEIVGVQEKAALSAIESSCIGLAGPSTVDAVYAASCASWCVMVRLRGLPPVTIFLQKAGIFPLCLQQCPNWQALPALPTPTHWLVLSPVCPSLFPCLSLTLSLPVPHSFLACPSLFPCLLLPLCGLSGVLWEVPHNLCHGPESGVCLGPQQRWAAGAVRPQGQVGAGGGGA
jgi:hypothetical protein